MARVRYTTNPDGHVDLDSGSSPVASTRKASVLAPEFAADRGETREGYSGLDEMIPQDGRSRPSQDRDLAVLQGGVAPSGRPLKARNRREADAARPLLSSRQSKDRARVKNRVQDELATTQLRELAHLIESPQRWAQVNDALSEQAGEAQQLPELRLRQIRRVDRAIQAYETASDRSHVVYANDRLPLYIIGSNVEGYVRDHLGGSVQTSTSSPAPRIACTRSTSNPGKSTARTIARGASTRRGTYLGRPESAGDTSHPLPLVASPARAGLATSRGNRPDGTVGERYVLQMRATPTPPKKESVMSTQNDDWLPQRRSKDKHGRPRLLMNPAIKKGPTQLRPATAKDVDRDRRPEETNSQ